jgi:large subunit ribosomal protein L24
MKKYKIALMQRLPAETFNDKLRVGDKVIIIAGKSKGQTGTLKKKLRSPSGLRYVVQGCNMVTKHQKPNPQLQQAGGIVKKEASIHSSNVAIYNVETQKADKVAVKKEGKNLQRFYKSTQKEIVLPKQGKQLKKEEVTQ